MGWAYGLCCLSFDLTRPSSNFKLQLICFSFLGITSEGSQSGFSLLEVVPSGYSDKKKKKNTPTTSVAGGRQVAKGVTAAAEKSPQGYIPLPALGRLGGSSASDMPGTEMPMAPQEAVFPISLCWLFLA